MKQRLQDPLNFSNAIFSLIRHKILLATSSTYSVVGTPEELRTLYHSSFVRLPFLSLSDFLKYLFTCIDKKYLDNMCIFKKEIFYVQEKLTSRYFLISRSAVAEELPLLKKLMLISFVLLAQRLKAQAPRQLSNGKCNWRWAMVSLQQAPGLTSMWYAMGWKRRLYVHMVTGHGLGWGNCKGSG